MSGRGILFIVILVAAGAGPYFLSNGENREKLAKWWKSVRNKSAEDDMSTEALIANLRPTSLSHAAGKGGKANAATNPPVRHLEHLLRFDLTPTWVIESWPRVTTRLVDGQLEGLRVTLVTGTNAHDLVGSLTYYFDKRLQLQRIKFHGHTGDPRRLVGLVTQYYGLQLDSSVGGWLFAAKWNGQPTSLLHVQHVPVVKADNRRHRVQVDLELNRPGAPHGLSSASQKFLSTKSGAAGRKSSRRLAS